MDLVSGLGNTRFPLELELHYFRIVSELMNNTIKHSGATKATIKLSFIEGMLVMIYIDNGKGYSLKEALKTSEGHGLSNIIHRVNLIKGELEFLPKKNGTEVHIRKLIE